MRSCGWHRQRFSCQRYIGKPNIGKPSFVGGEMEPQHKQSHLNTSHLGADVHVPKDDLTTILQYVATWPSFLYAHHDLADTYEEASMRLLTPARTAVCWTTTGRGCKLSSSSSMQQRAQLPRILLLHILLEDLIDGLTWEQMSVRLVTQPRLPSAGQLLDRGCTLPAI